MVELRKLRDALSIERSTLSASRLGIVGSLVAGIGAFFPIVDSLGHHVTYFARGHGDGQTVVGAAFIGLVAATIRVRIVTSLAGLVVVAMLWGFYGPELALIARLGPARYLAETLWNHSGLYVMTFGAVLMILSPLFRRRRK